MDTLTKPSQEQRALAERLSSEGVHFALGAWVDVLGRARSKMVPIDHLPALLSGSERYTPRGMGGLGRMDPVEDECVAIPDPDTLLVLPWDQRVAFMNADLVASGDRPWENCPRSILKSMIRRCSDLGYRFNLGVETEFYVYRQSALPDLQPLSLWPVMHPTPCYDLEPTLDSLEFLDRLHSYMAATDFGVFSFDQEGGDGQYEFDCEHDEVLATCDKITLFRLMLRQAAKEVDGFVTFMPKPSPRVWGSGAHMNMSLESLDTGENMFKDSADQEDPQWTKLAMAFVAGLIDHAPALSALTAPSVNSYKRLVGRLHDGSISWAPVWAAWGNNNRSCMMRLPDNRPALENRAVDTSANMYLAAAFTLAAGLDGVERQLLAGDPVQHATYEWDPRAREHEGRRRLPRTLLEAIDAFQEDPLVHEVFGQGFVDDYVDMKHDEWDEYNAQVTPWELDRYLTNL